MGSEMCIRDRGARIFLDVEDLEDIGDLELYVESSSVVLIFLSRGYFLSKNCMREVAAAIEMNKPIVLVHELNPSKGGASLQALKAECPEEHRVAVFGVDEAPRLVIPWMRIESFQLESLELIAEETLQHLPRYRISSRAPHSSVCRPTPKLTLVCAPPPAGAASPVGSGTKPCRALRSSSCPER